MQSPPSGFCILTFIVMSIQLSSRHRSFFLIPGSHASWVRETSSVFREQVAMSGDLVAHSSRQILSQLRHHKITVTDTVMSSFFHPMYAFIHLFLYVLKHPQASTIMGDLALLDVATGHFGQLELASDGILAFHLPRECTALCLKAIRVAKDLRLEPVNTVAATPQSTNLDSVETTNMEGGADDFNTRDILSWPEDLVTPRWLFSYAS